MFRQLASLVLVAAGLTVSAPGPASATGTEPGGRFVCGGRLWTDQTDVCGHWYIASAATNTNLHTEAPASATPARYDQAYSWASTQYAGIAPSAATVTYRTLDAFVSARCDDVGALAPPPTLTGRSIVTGLSVAGRTVPDTTQYQRITTPTAYVELNVQLLVPAAGGGSVMVQRPLVVTPRTPGGDPIIPVEARVGYEVSPSPSIGGGPCRY